MKLHPLPNMGWITFYHFQTSTVQPGMDMLFHPTFHRFPIIKIRTPARLSYHSFEEMTYRSLSTKPLPDFMMTYCQLEPGNIFFLNKENFPFSLVYDMLILRMQCSELCFSGVKLPPMLRTFNSFVSMMNSTVWYEFSGTSTLFVRQFALRDWQYVGPSRIWSGKLR